jgi:signal transduction histidine kinase
MRMDRKAFLITSGVMYSTLALGCAILFFNDHPDRFIALGLYALLALLFAYINHLNYRDGRYSRWLLAAALALCLGIQFFDASGYPGFYFVILGCAAMFHLKLRFSGPFAALTVLLSLLPALHGDYTLAAIGTACGRYLLPRAFILAGIVIARYALLAGNKNRELAEQLQKKSAQLEEAFSQLQAGMEELKETADLRAREALMRELHDKLGHLLTTALIGAQAAEVLMDRDAQAAKARLGLAAEQIRQAMQALRRVITGGSLLDEEDQGFTQRLKLLISEAETHAGVVIRNDLDAQDAAALDALPAQVRVFIYNALTEGLTNGTRHGAARAFDFSLAHTADGWTFALRDDGRGFGELRPGYGLTKMRRDAERMGGTLQIDGSQGCSLAVCLPENAGEEAVSE